MTQKKWLIFSMICLFLVVFSMWYFDWFYCAAKIDNSLCADVLQARATLATGFLTLLAGFFVVIAAIIQAHQQKMEAVLLRNAYRYRIILILDKIKNRLAWSESDDMQLYNSESQLFYGITQYNKLEELYNAFNQGNNFILRDELSSANWNNHAKLTPREFEFIQDYLEKAENCINEMRKDKKLYSSEIPDYYNFLLVSFNKLIKELQTNYAKDKAKINNFLNS